MNYYTEYWQSPDEDRNIEIINCINKNIASGFFDNIFIFSEKFENRINIPIIISSRKTYQDMFDQSINGINILSCADIEFDSSIKLAKDIKEKQFYALTKYENDGFLHKHYTKNSYSDSQDVWIWKNSSRIRNANFFMGIIGADNALAYIAESSGYDIINPCLSIKVYHKHEIASRLGSSGEESKRLRLHYKTLEVVELK